MDIEGLQPEVCSGDRQRPSGWRSDKGNRLAAPDGAFGPPSTFTLTAHAKARGWDAAFGAGVVRVKEGQSGRGERGSPATNDLPITMRLAEPPGTFELVRSA